MLTPAIAKACEIVQEFIAPHTKILVKDNARAGNLLTKLKNFEKECTTVEGRIVIQAKKTAEGRGCKAMRESEKLNGEINTSSVNCGNTAKELNVEISEFEKNNMGPDTLWVSTPEDGIANDPYLRSHCQNELNFATQLRQKAVALNQMVIQAVQRTADDREKYLKLATATYEMKTKSALTAKNCVSDSENVAVQSSYQNERIPSSKQSIGNPVNKGQSTISGVKEAQEKTSLTNEILKDQK